MTNESALLTAAPRQQGWEPPPASAGEMLHHSAPRGENSPSAEHSCRRRGAAYTRSQPAPTRPPPAAAPHTVTCNGGQRSYLKALSPDGRPPHPIDCRCTQHLSTNERRRRKKRPPLSWSRPAGPGGVARARERLRRVPDGQCERPEERGAPASGGRGSGQRRSQPSPAPPSSGLGQGIETRRRR